MILLAIKNLRDSYFRCNLQENTISLFEY